MRRLFPISLVLLFSAAVGAHAGPITYNLHVNVTGTIGTTSFTQASAVISQTGDTSAIFAVNNFVYNDSGTSTITIQGIGTATILDSTFGAFAEPHDGRYESLGFYDQNGMFEIGELGADFSYYLDTGVDSGGSAGSSSNPSESTSLGLLTVTRVGSNGTFVAYTPEPTGLVLLGTGAIGLAGTLRRRVKGREMERG